MEYNDKNLSPYSAEQAAEEELVKRINRHHIYFVIFVIVLIVSALASCFTPHKWIVFAVLAVFFLFNKIFFAKLKSDTKKYFDLVDGKEEE
ncbi:hypothetical protein IKQ26_09020 [bacterium]|nr:hypothetical protein [bacterium]